MVVLIKTEAPFFQRHEFSFADDGVIIQFNIQDASDLVQLAGERDVFTRKGQVTIPVAVRRLLGLRPEGKISLVLNEESKTVQLRLPKYPTIASLAGAAGSLKQHVPWKEMLETARGDALANKGAAPKHG